MKNSLLIGIDGGGTHATGVAACPDGRVVAVARSGGMNFHNIGVEPVRARIEQLVGELCAHGQGEAAAICIGMSALDSPADAETLRCFTIGALPSDRLDLQSDAYIALMGFTLGEPGMIVICGTGSMLLAMDSAGRQFIAGGWGYLLHDAGSAYTLARDGLLAIIQCEEGLGSPTPLTDDALEYFGASTPRGLIDRIYKKCCTPDTLADFARCVLRRASEHDPISFSILEENMLCLANQAAHRMRQTPEAWRVGTYGGIFAHSPLARRLFSENLVRACPEAQVSTPEYPPELGAVIHLMKRRGRLSAPQLNRLKSTYEEQKP